MSKLSINAGDLDKRVRLLRPVYTNEFQDEIAHYEEAARTWAAIRPAVAHEVTEAGRTVMRVDIPITIRFRTDLDARWRVAHGEALYQIQGIVNPMHSNERLDLQCKEIQ